MSQATGISIVIRTSNSEKPLRTLLSRLKIALQDEIIVVDTGSTDGTISLAEKASAKIIRNIEPFNYSHTLNLGFRAAQNNWVLALSVHCVPVNADFLDRYRAALAELPQTTVMIHGLQAFSRKGYDRLAKNVVAYSGSVSPRQWRGGGNPNALYFRPAWEKHPFDETIPRGEDAEWRDWALEAGYTCAEVPEACMLYRHNKGPLYRYKKAYDDVMICSTDIRPMSFRQLAFSILAGTRHLLWEDFHFSAWIGEMARSLGAFFASRQKNKRST